jgi:hypothetical protein
MNVTDIFIKRPVLSTVVSLVITIVGLQALFTLNVRQYPRSDNASVTVSTVYVGASAELVRGFITTPLERAIAAADGIDYIASESRQGLSTITARLELNVDAIKALSEISSKVDQVRGDLPAGGRGAHHQCGVCRQPIRIGVPLFHIRYPPAKPDYRLSRAGGAAAVVGHCWCAAGRHPGRPNLCHAHLAQA